MSKYLNIEINTKKNYLTTLEKPYKINNTLYKVKCRCDCGKIKDINCRHFLKGNIKSCGCINKGNTKHNLKNNEPYLYNRWKELKRKNDLCKDWINPENFIEWIKKSEWKKGLFLQKKDCSKPLGPDNSILVDKKQKFVNTQKRLGNIKTFKGKTLKEWAFLTNRCVSGITNKVSQLGWNKAISTKKYESSLPNKIKKLLKDNNIKYKTEQKFEFQNKYCYADIVVKNLVIETDGLYWHSDLSLTKKGFNPKTYHSDKLNIYNKNGLNSLFFREDEIRDKFDIVSSIILNRLSKSKVIYARKCSLVEAGDSCFFLTNHLMGKGKGKIISLIYNGEIVSSLQFIYKDNEIKIERFCNKLNTVVVGGLSKILKRLNNPISSFVDLRYGNGNSLKKIGFVLSNCHPSFKWTDFKNTYHRMNFKGDSGYNAGLYKIWDCGQAKFVRV